jgi:hypothetical protein
VEVNISSLNEGDSFLLDIGRKLFVWIGSQSNPRYVGLYTHALLQQVGIPDMTVPHISESGPRPSTSRTCCPPRSSPAFPSSSSTVLIPPPSGDHLMDADVSGRPRKPAPEEDDPEFWETIGGRRVPIKGADKGGDDAEVEARFADSMVLYKYALSRTCSSST